jgi:hypothetical protein
MERVAGLKREWILLTSKQIHLRNPQLLGSGIVGLLLLTIVR